MSTKQPNKHLKRTNPYCVSLFPKYCTNMRDYKREIEMSGKCITRQATPEEMERLRNM